MTENTARTAEERAEFLSSIGLTEDTMLAEVLFFLSSRSDDKSGYKLREDERKMICSLQSTFCGEDKQVSRHVLEVIWTGALFSQLCADAFTVDEIDETAGMFSVETSQGLVYPRFQFDQDGRNIPSVRRVMKQSRPNISPVVIYVFMTYQNKELAGLTPVEWLLEGFREDVVGWLAEEL